MLRTVAYGEARHMIGVRKPIAQLTRSAPTIPDLRRGSALLGARRLVFLDLQASVSRTWPKLFLCKDSEIAPRRR